MTLDLAIFGVSAIVAVFGATMMIAQRNPIASVLFFILSILAQAVLYLQLGALFVGLMLIIVYAGAIMVLFLFVIMLLNLRVSGDDAEKTPPLSRLTKLVLGALMALELAFIVRGMAGGGTAAGFMNAPVTDFGSAISVSRLLYTKYMYPLQLTGVLLLVAVVAAVVIARRDSTDGLEEEPAAADTGAERRTQKVGS